MRNGLAVAVYPGSFDPVTNGHMDVIHRATSFTEKLVVVVSNNPAKTPFFTVEERMEHLRRLTSCYDNVEVDSFSGLLMDYVKAVNARLLIRGLRTVMDFESEMQMAWINRSMGPETEIVFIPSSMQYLHVSSSAVRELARYGGDYGHMVPSIVFEAIRGRIQVGAKWSY